MPFNPADPVECLRLLCGAAFVPHIWAKIFRQDVTLGFFKTAGYRPAKAAMYAALGVETIAAAGLIAEVLVPYAAGLAALFLLVATASVLKVSRGAWLWNTGGCEYTAFWAAACAVVAIFA